MDWYPNLLVIKKKRQPWIALTGSCIFLTVCMAVNTNDNFLVVFCINCYSTVIYKKINMTSLEHLLQPGKCKNNMTTNLEPDNVFSTDIMALEPSFDVPIVNITVVAGKTAVLPCSIDSLGDFKVSQIYRPNGHLHCFFCRVERKS